MVQGQLSAKQCRISQHHHSRPSPDLGQVTDIFCPGQNEHLLILARTRSFHQDAETEMKLRCPCGDAHASKTASSVDYDDGLPSMSKQPQPLLTLAETCQNYTEQAATRRVSDGQTISRNRGSREYFAASGRKSKWLPTWENIINYSKWFSNFVATGPT